MKLPNCFLRGCLHRNYPEYPGHIKASLKRAGKLHRLGAGRAHAGERVILLIDNTQATVTHQTTGEILGEYKIEPTKLYWAKRKDPN
jgi:hypothetical protein